MNYENYRPTSSKLLPDVVKNLLIINVIMYLATLALQQQGVDLIDMLGLHYFSSEEFRIYQFVTYMFLHDSGGFAHVLLNMLALYMFGSTVENVWGGKKFLTYYMLTGFGAAITHYTIMYFSLQPEITFFNNYINASSPAEMTNLLSTEAYKYFYSNEFSQLIQSNSIPLSESVDYAIEMKTQMLNAPVIIGASGAVFGVLLAYGMLFPNSLLYLFFAIPMKAKYVVIMYGVIELISGISGRGNVAHFAHLGGLITGFIIITYWKNKNKQRQRDYWDQS
jgi:membrane associated rhomboid family serine protease